MSFAKEGRSLTDALSIPLHIRLSPSTREALADLAAREGHTVASMARVLIMQGLIRKRTRPGELVDISQLVAEVNPADAPR